MNIDNQLLENFKFLNWHLARLKFFVSIICTISKLQTVNYIKLSQGLGGKAKPESNLRKIQRFFADFDLDLDMITQLILRLLPVEPPYTLSMDRTNWKFGKLDFNILMICVCYQGVGIPLIWMMLPKKGNSNTKERIQIMKRCISVIDGQNIQCLLADREFIGVNWFEWLIDEKIWFHIRIKENILIDVPGKGRVKAFWLFKRLQPNQPLYYHKIVAIDSNRVYLSGMSIISKGKKEYLILASYNRENDPIEKYRDRWQIETMFKAMKSSGYNMEDTHLTDANRLSKLVAIICIAFVWAYRAGVYIHEQVKPIRILKNGRRAKSFFKYGLEKLAHILLVLVYRQDSVANEEIKKYAKLLSCT